MFYIEARKIGKSLNQGYRIPEKIFKNKRFLNYHNMLLAGVDKYDLLEKSSIVGHCVNYAIKDGMSDEVLDIAEYFVRRLRDLNSKRQDVNEIINIIYSTFVKKVKPNDIISGKVSPQKYRNMVDSGIKNYYENPIDGKIDYRHIAGRMVMLKNMWRDVSNSIGKSVFMYSPIRWTEELQLDYLEIMEKIARNYEKYTDNFNITIGARYKIIERPDYDNEMQNRKYRENIVDLINMIKGKVLMLMQEPIKNKELIKDKLDIAYSYYDKIPYSDPYITIFIKLIEPLKQIDENLSKILKKYKKST